jgi:hypothetical protein
MRRDEFRTLMKVTYTNLLDLNNTKGSDYAGDEDALANFKEQAASLGLTPEAVWGVYAGKHWSAIMTFIRKGEVQSEPIEGRIDDLLLYLLLLKGLIFDARPAGTLEAPIVADGLIRETAVGVQKDLVRAWDWALPDDLLHEEENN